MSTPKVLSPRNSAMKTISRSNSRRVDLPRTEFSFNSWLHQHPGTPRSPSYILHVTPLSVPVIDLAGLEDPRRRLRIMHDLVNAAQEWGCFQLINHGISVTLLEDMMRVSKDFFGMPDEEKHSFSLADFKEGFGQSYRTVTGAQNWREVFRHEVAPLVQECVDMWPTKPEAYQEVTLQYAKQVTSISQSLLALLSEGLGLKPDYIERSMGGEVTARLLLNNYPAAAGIEAYGLPSHTDPNTLTFLTQDQVGGLEAFHDGKWIPVRCIPNALTVNVSDHLQVLSNGKYKSVVHRVVINPQHTRTSIGVFVAPAQTATLQVATEIVSTEKPAIYRPMKFADYLKEYYKAGQDQTAVFQSCLLRL